MPLFSQSQASSLGEPHRVEETETSADVDRVSAREVVPQNRPWEVATKSAEDFLVVSPYTDRAHLLDPTALNHAQVLLAKALSLLTPITTAYAIVPYVAAFNWDAVFHWLAAAAKADAFTWREQYFYIVIFRSQVPPSTDRSHLDALDKKAHAEAMETNGLLKYWFGIPDDDGRNLATCKFPRPCSNDAAFSDSAGRHLATTCGRFSGQQW